MRKNKTLYVKIIICKRTGNKPEICKRTSDKPSIIVRLSTVATSTQVFAQLALHLKDIDAQQFILKLALSATSFRVVWSIVRLWFRLPEIKF